MTTIYRDTERPETERKLAFDVLQDYASDQPNVLANMLMDSEEKDFAVLFEKLKAHQEAVVPLLEEEMVKSLPEATEVKKDGLAKRQARAAVAMIRMGRSGGGLAAAAAQCRPPAAELHRQLAEAPGCRSETDCR